ncbi:PepSY domain-containing protein [Sphingorhabdus sp. IMCC26285]|uniref:PepSY domain-containing protein n=2 Tax=Sphingorhabdus profundilacus TaxID=2509718 RepID=A0A6I4LWL3_9SPHN|nr:PepSY domain-containing protein [Sphingorhabdus profundilacus]
MTMRMISTLALAAASAIALASVPASATGVIKCKAGPVSGWKTQDELTKKLTKEGWTVRKSKVDGGCYEVYGTTPEGDRVEAYFHPVTLEKLYVGRRGEVLFRKQGY